MLPLARSLAARYRNRGIDLDDLTQAANLALTKAARGFDPRTGTSFLAYAVPTIRGEIRRYFRDCGWAVRPTRRIQELQARIGAANETLVQQLGRSPRPSEVAAHLDVCLDDVTEALAADGCFAPTSLDRPVTDDHGSCSLGELLGGLDPGAAGAEARVMLGPAVRALEERDRLILRRRFFDGWTQQEIGDEIGVTQMQVSRLLHRILGTLREAVGDEAYLG